MTSYQRQKSFSPSVLMLVSIFVGVGVVATTLSM